DDVVAPRRTAHEAAAVLDGDADVGPIVEAAGILAEPSAHDVVDADRVDLDAVDGRGAEGQRRQQVAAAACADDERGVGGRRRGTVVLRLVRRLLRRATA